MSNIYEVSDDATEGEADHDTIGDTHITLYGHGDRREQADFLRRLADLVEKEQP